MKLAISGKGGVGKTTWTALLAKAFSNKGYKVLAIDADPDANLATALGYPDPDAIRPIAEMEALIEERTGAKPGTVGTVFRMNPFATDFVICQRHFRRTLQQVVGELAGQLQILIFAGAGICVRQSRCHPAVSATRPNIVPKTGRPLSRNPRLQ